MSSLGKKLLELVLGDEDERKSSPVGAENWACFHGEESLKDEPLPPPDVVQLTSNLHSCLETLYTTIRLYNATEKNLTAVQEKCNELMEENRKLKEKLK